MRKKLVQPAVAAVAEHERGDRRLRIIPVHHGAGRMVKIPHGTAVKAGVLPVLYDIKAPSFPVPLDKVFLQPEHILPGSRIQDLRIMPAGVRILSIVAVNSMFRHHHIVGDILDLPDRRIRR